MPKGIIIIIFTCFAFGLAQYKDPKFVERLETERNEYYVVNGDTSKSWKDIKRKKEEQIFSEPNKQCVLKGQ
jgi:hypothetical protein